MSTADTKLRLQEIEKQLAGLVEEQTRIKAQWDSEKELISASRDLKSELEQLRVQAEEHERQGDYGKVAEIRYGRIARIERQIEENRKKIEEKQAAGDLIMKEEIDAEDIADIVSRWTGIPVSKMLQSERQKLLGIEDELHKRVIGQHEAVSAVSEAVKRSRAGMGDEKRPIGSFIFLGPTGVGKTELARTLAEYLFDDEDALIRIDMSEYMESHNVSRLVGAPPGYVGYEEGGQLTEAVRRKPFSVVLLDEIEKAHPDVFNILLQILDDGRLTDSKGHTVNFKNTIIIMTSNIGAHLIQSEMEKIDGMDRDSVLAGLHDKLFLLLKQQVRPEFLNRIDEIILFTPLSREDLRHIVQVQFDRIRATAMRQRIAMEITPEALDWLANAGFDPVFGARPLKRVLQRKITNKLSEMILSGSVQEGDGVSIDLSEGEMRIAVTAGEA
ncbi:MAG: AAA family ATPase [Chlorobium sp.]|jgi:ATP-dependent Clp protease ATP-binding subunit ClpB|uniref:AAA family ATPase n=1 Tax=Chlorobium sp. TaxID=1095 RepID=UPI001DD7C980|nr:AAA family ATPase [Chlorobium sp.]MBN1278533.1 AAA family ATPase [Chlorobiaceae bacterium]MCF8215561.1 AAA family ATPase [Chlorobium sp.]MCF8270385.1 AAA family ATPase [Chlorobium sp.]MCF8286754.1 AAA family ATPase [Chlorobium sp.]MCF8290276.1 AAA family ATPase [Chlorobium sp.]